MIAGFNATSSMLVPDPLSSRDDFREAALTLEGDSTLPPWAVALVVVAIIVLPLCMIVLSWWRNKKAQGGGCCAPVEASKGFWSRDDPVQQVTVSVELSNQPANESAVEPSAEGNKSVEEPTAEGNESVAEPMAEGNESVEEPTAEGNESVEEPTAETGTTFI